MVGGSIIIPIDIKVEATTISITIKGMYITNPIIKAVLSSLTIKLGMSTEVGMSFSDVTSCVPAI